MSSPRPPQVLLALAAALGVALAAAPASARPYIPADLQKAIDMPCAPPCTVCHKDSNGGYGTAIKPFVEDMTNHGFDPFDPASIPKAVAALEQDPADADGDGKSDIDELREGLDPNTPGAASVCGPDYGCLRVGPRGRVDGFASVASLATLMTFAALLRRRKRR